MGSSLVLNRRPKVPAEDTAAFGAIAERFRRAGALEQAVSLCRDGLKKFPDHVSARVTLGWSLLDLGKYDEARIELEQVMRRAPDNLAAIRGLAELHDRFEHTLNLPMDGPGQWPPPAESVDGEAASDPATIHGAAATLDVVDASISERFEAAEPAESEPGFSEAAMAPAAMGLPLWTPEPAPSPVAEAEPAPITSTGSGMSSVREIDPFACAPVQVPAQVVAKTRPAPQTRVVTEEDEDVQLEIDAPVVAVSARAGVTDEIHVTPEVTPYVAEDELGVTDDALAALIAEAESLDAVAALETGAASDALELGLELGNVEVELDTAATVELETAGPMELELADVAPAVEPVVEPVLEYALEPPFEAALEPAIEIELESVREPQAELEFAPEVEEGAEVIAFAARSTAVAETVEPEPMAFLQDEQEETVAQVVAMPSKAAATAAKVAALEQMLRRVRARRHQLMAESVA